MQPSLLFLETEILNILINFSQLQEKILRVIAADTLLRMHWKIQHFPMDPSTTTSAYCNGSDWPRDPMLQVSVTCNVFTLPTPM